MQDRIIKVALKASIKARAKWLISIFRRGHLPETIEKADAVAASKSPGELSSYRSICLLEVAGACYIQQATLNCTESRRYVYTTVPFLRCPINSGNLKRSGKFGRGSHC